MIAGQRQNTARVRTMSSFLRRTLGLSRDSLDVESYSLNQDDPMQEHLATPLPHQGDPVNTSRLHHRSDYTHVYPPTHPSSVQPHSNPVSLPPAAPESSSGTHELPAEQNFAELNSNQSMELGQGQRSRREDRNDAAVPKHRLQRQTKTPRPFYEEPVST